MAEINGTGTLHRLADQEWQPDDGLCQQHWHCDDGDLATDLPPLADVDTALLDITLTLQAHYPTAPRYAIVWCIAARAMHAERRLHEQYEQILDLTVNSISSGAVHGAR